MNISDLRDKAQFTDESNIRDVIWYAPFIRQISIYLTNYFLRTNITANQITLMSAITGVIAGISFSFGSGIPSIIGSLILFLAFVLDACDGEVARFRNNCSLTGHTFDMFAQMVGFVSAMFGISVGCLTELGKLPGIIGFLGVTIYLLSSNLSLTKYNVAVDCKLKGNAPYLVPYYTENIFNNDQSLKGIKFNTIIPAIIYEYIKTPNQIIIFFIISIFDAMVNYKLIFLNYSFSLLACYIILFSIIITIVFFYKIIYINAKMESDIIFSQIK